MSISEWVVVVATALSAVATAVASILNWRVTRETQLLRLAQTEPAISLHLERGQHLQFLMLVIQNYGQSVAYDLKWQISPPLADLTQHELTLDSLKLLEGFEHLAPKQRVETFMCSALDALATHCPPIVVTVTFRTAQGKQMNETFTLNPCQFAGITQVGDTTEEAVVKSLEKLATAVDRATSSDGVRIARGSKPWQRNARLLRNELDAEIAAAARDQQHVVVASGETTSPDSP